MFIPAPISSTARRNTLNPVADHQSHSQAPHSGVIQIPELLHIILIVRGTNASVEIQNSVSAGHD
jgi:hypothetical protein